MISSSVHGGISKAGYQLNAVVNDPCKLDDLCKMRLHQSPEPQKSVHMKANPLQTFQLECHFKFGRPFYHPLFFRQFLKYMN